MKQPKQREFIKKSCLIVLLTSLVLAAGIITSGCIQNPGSNSGQQPGNTASSVKGTEQPANPSGRKAESNPGQYHNRTLGNGQRPQFDLETAASKLRVTEQQLSDALNIGNTTQGHRGNLSDAAQNLGVTEQQIRDAPGFPAGGRPNSSPTQPQS